MGLFSCMDKREVVRHLQWWDVGVVRLDQPKGLDQHASLVNSHHKRLLPTIQRLYKIRLNTPKVLQKVAKTLNLHNILTKLEVYMLYAKISQKVEQWTSTLYLNNYKTAKPLPTHLWTPMNNSIKKLNNSQLQIDHLSQHLINKYTTTLRSNSQMISHSTTFHSLHFHLLLIIWMIQNQIYLLPLTFTAYFHSPS